MQFPGGESRALKIGARFRYEHVDFLSLFERDANYAEGGADSGGGEGSSITLRHDLAFAWHEFGAVATDGFVGGFLFKVDLLGLRDEGLFDFLHVEGLPGEFGETGFHSFERPK